MAEVAHDRGAVPHDREPRRHVELAGPFTRGAEFAQEVAGSVEDQHARSIRSHSEYASPVPKGHSAAAVHDVEIPALIELDVHDCAEHLPVLAFQHTDAEDLFEVGVQALVAPGEVDDFLCRWGLGGREGAGEKKDGSG